MWNRDKYGGLREYTKKFAYIYKCNKLDEWIAMLNEKLQNIVDFELLDPKEWEDFNLGKNVSENIYILKEYLIDYTCHQQRRYYIWMPLGLLFEKECQEKLNAKVFTSYNLDFNYKIDFIDQNTNIGYYIKLTDAAFNKTIKKDLPILRKALKKYKLNKIIAITTENTYVLIEA